MQIEITNKFRKQVEKHTNKRLRLSLHNLLQKVVLAESLSDISNLKKLKGHKNIFRIRMGNYRIGIVLNDKTVIFAAFDHRSDIYKYFP